MTKVDATTFTELDTRGGKPVYRYTYHVATDGRTVGIVVDDLRAATTTRLTAIKQ
ncbi:hypothetical protein [Sphingomonas bacterium]|uniref:hypothetical protein n=1 Tax=Sphingomonas bacterium TaxID=1895847 RepID=UPI001575FB68|nr:hypothetical protein [Sphingomonas bacterium]